MVMMFNVYEFNIAHPERLDHSSICLRYVYNVDLGSVSRIALTKHITFRQSLPQITCSSRQPCAAAG